MRPYVVQIWSRWHGWLGWGGYYSAWVAQAVQHDLEYRQGIAARLVERRPS